MFSFVPPIPRCMEQELAARSTGFLFLCSIILISDFLDILQPAHLLMPSSVLVQRMRQARVCVTHHTPLPPIEDFLKSSEDSYAQSPPEGELSLQALPAQSHTHPAQRQPCCYVFASACQPAPTRGAAGLRLLNRLPMVGLAPSSEHSLSEAALPNLLPALHHPHVADQENLNSTTLAAHDSFTALCNTPLVDSGLEGWSFCSLTTHLLFCSSPF